MRSPLALTLFTLLWQLSPITAREVDLTPVKKWIEAQSKLDSLHGTFVQERKMKTIKRTFEKEGSFWYQSPGRVRWDIGQDYLAVKNDKEVLIMQPKKKKMKKHTLTGLREDERFRGLTFIEAGFPRTLADFQRGFQVTRIVKEDNYYNVETKIRDGKASLALTKLVFYIYEEDYQLKPSKCSSGTSRQSTTALPVSLLTKLYLQAPSSPTSRATRSRTEKRRN